MSKGFFRSMLIVFIFILVFSVNSYAAVIVDINKGDTYTSKELYELSKKLVKTYPDILHMEIIGYSVDLKPIYVIVMTDNIKEEIKSHDFNVSRMHYYVEAGMHAREIANPVNVLKMIENYAMDYYNDNHIKGFSVKKELKDSAIHFIPLVNPDGFDLVKFGKKYINTPKASGILQGIKDKNYKRWKANIAGVDLNKNFPDEYYDVESKTWVNKFGKYPNGYHSTKPGKEFYGGPYGGSEPETQALMDYILRYDFRNFLSLHSMGKYVDCGKYWFGEDFASKNLELAKLVNKVNGYRIETRSNGKGGGYLSDFVVARTYKPIVTVETTAVQAPTPQEYYEEAYKDTYLLPLYFVRHGRKEGYFKYRLYKDNEYIRDYYNEIYAYANAERIGGIIVEGEGKPNYYLYEPMARKEFLDLVLKEYFDYNFEFHNPSLTVSKDVIDKFKDELDIYIDFAIFTGILSSENYRPNDFITVYEAAQIIYNIHRVFGKQDINKNYHHMELPSNCPSWAKDAVRYSLYNGYADMEFFKDKYVLEDKNDYILEKLFNDDFPQL